MNTNYCCGQCSQCPYTATSSAKEGTQASMWSIFRTLAALMLVVWLLGSLVTSSG